MIDQPFLKKSFGLFGVVCLLSACNQPSTLTMKGPPITKVVGANATTGRNQPRQTGTNSRTNTGTGTSTTSGTGTGTGSKSGSGSGTAAGPSTGTVTSEQDDAPKTPHENKILTDVSILKGGTIYLEIGTIQKTLKVNCLGLRKSQIRWETPTVDAVTKDYSGKFLADITCVSRVSGANGNNDVYRASFAGAIDKNTEALTWDATSDVAAELLIPKTPGAQSGT